MSDKPKEQDPFKPQEPNIPGVTGNPARNKLAPEPPRSATSQFRGPTVAAEKSPRKNGWQSLPSLSGSSRSHSFCGNIRARPRNQKKFLQPYRLWIFRR